MSTEIAPRSAPSMAEKVDYCRLLAESGLLPDSYRGKPANVLYAIEYGDTLGISPMAAITGVHVIKGKPSASAALISGLVRRAGHKLRVTGDAQSAKAQIIRADDPDFTFEATFTMQDAERAELLKKDIWQQYPAAMLKNRAITAVCRDACEEVLFGLHYTPEELGAPVDAEGLPAEQSAPAVQREHPDQPRTGEWSTSTSTPQPEPVQGAGEIADAEIVKETPAEPPSEAPKANKALLRAVNIEVTKRVGSKDEDRLGMIADIVGRPITSSSELTVDEARGVLAALAKADEQNGQRVGTPEGWTSEQSDHLAADFLAELQGSTNDAARVEIAGRIAKAVKAGKLTAADRETLLAAYTGRQQQPAGVSG